jgi:hypothetical protein
MYIRTCLTVTFLNGRRAFWISVTVMGTVIRYYNNIVNTFLYFFLLLCFYIPARWYMRDTSVLIRNKQPEVPMSEELGKALPFRQWLRNQERLEYLDKRGLNRAEIINRAVDEFLTKNFKSLIDDHSRELQELERKIAALV